MAALVLPPMPVPVSMAGIRIGMKRRHRSTSPDPEMFQKSLSLDDEVAGDDRPRKLRRVRDRPAVVLAMPEVVKAKPPFSASSAKDAQIEEDAIDTNGPISPAAFCQAMEGVLMQKETEVPPTLSSTRFNSPDTPHSSAAACPNAVPNVAAVSNGDWWFPTGDLVLGVENLMFRVHKRVLSENSVVFEDMFTLSEPSTGFDCDNIENVPRVQLQDSVEDWMVTLPWLYAESPSYDEQGLQTVSFSTIRSHMILSNKYDMPGLRRLSQTALERMYPTDFVELLNNPLPKDASAIVNAPSALLLAYQCDLPDILPTIMYHTSHNLDRDESSRLPVNLDRGYATLESVAAHLSTSLIIPSSMLLPQFRPDGHCPLDNIYQAEFHISCQEATARRWKTALTRCCANNASDSHGTHLLTTLGELNRIILEIAGTGEYFICNPCIWTETVVMQQTIAAIFTALPVWFGI